MEKIKCRGFTLLEILISLLILSLVITGVMSAFIASRRYVVRSRHRLQATNIARQVLEELYDDVKQDTWDTGNLSIGIHNLPNVTLDNINYTRSYTVSNIPPYLYRQVTVNVTWTEPSR